MNKQIFNFLKFVFVFIGTTSLMLFLYYQLTTSPFEKKFLLYGPGKNKAICTLSPDNQTFSECIHRYIPELIDEASPLDLLKVGDLFNELKKQDLFFEKFSQEKIERDYLINQYSFYMNLANYGVKRNRIDYFQVLIKPYVQHSLKEDLKTLKKTIEALDKSFYDSLSPEDQSSLDRLSQINLK